MTPTCDLMNIKTPRFWPHGLNILNPYKSKCVWTCNISVQIYCFTTRKGGKRGSMALKFYMAKAYNQTEWDFLKAFMKKMRFKEDWILFIMTCIKNVSYVVMINEQPGWKINHSRGLRQGDPIFLYLFCCVQKAFLVHHYQQPKRKV